MTQPIDGKLHKKERKRIVSIYFPVQAMRAYRGSGGIAPPIFKPNQCEWFLSNDNNNNNNNNNNNSNTERHTVLRHINSIILDDCKVFRDVIVNQLLSNNRSFTEFDCLLYDPSYII